MGFKQTGKSLGEIHILEGSFLVLIGVEITQKKNDDSWAYAKAVGKEKSEHIVEITGI